MYTTLTNDEYRGEYSSVFKYTCSVNKGHRGSCFFFLTRGRKSCDTVRLTRLTVDAFILIPVAIGPRLSLDCQLHLCLHLFRPVICLCMYLYISEPVNIMCICMRLNVCLLLLLNMPLLADLSICI
jgi:hypothetical protein